MDDVRWLVHNCVAHPILGVTSAWAKLGRWFHEITTPEDSWRFK